MRSVQKMLMVAMAEKGQWDTVDKAIAAFRARDEPCFAASTMTMLINQASRAKRLDTCALTRILGCQGLLGCIPVAIQDNNPLKVVSALTLRIHTLISVLGCLGLYHRRSLWNRCWHPFGNTRVGTCAFIRV